MVLENAHHKAADRGDDQRGGSDNLAQFQNPGRVEPIQVNQELFGDKAPIVKDYLARLSNPDATPTAAGDQTAKSYQALRGEVESRVIDQNGVRPDASTKDIQRLIAMNDGEMSAMGARTAALSTSHERAKTLAQYG